MNEEYNRLKKQYDLIGQQISNLHDKQNKIRDLMEAACTHVNLQQIEPDEFLVGIDVENEEVTYKCKDCYCYISEEELNRKR